MQLHGILNEYNVLREYSMWLMVYYTLYSWTCMYILLVFQHVSTKRGGTKGGVPLRLMVNYTPRFSSRNSYETFKYTIDYSK